MKAFISTSRGRGTFAAIRSRTVQNFPPLDVRLEVVMFLRRKRTLIVVASLLLAALAGGYYYLNWVCLPDFRTVREGVLYRSGQPRGLGLDWLGVKGIRTIVNLRKPDGDGMAGERAFAAKHGIGFHNLDLGADRAQIEERVDFLLSVFDDPDDWPVLVHCSRGIERSGMVAALFRIEYNGWTSEAAIGEARRYGLEDDSQLIRVAFLEQYRRRGSPAVTENASMLCPKRTPSED